MASSSKFNPYHDPRNGRFTFASGGAVAALVDLARRAKVFAGDQDGSNGKTDQGRALLFEIEDLIQAVRRRRVKAKAGDEDGEVSGD